MSSSEKGSAAAAILFEPFEGVIAKEEPWWETDTAEVSHGFDHASAAIIKEEDGGCGTNAVAIKEEDAFADNAVCTNNTAAAAKKCHVPVAIKEEEDAYLSSSSGSTPTEMIYNADEKITFKVDPNNCIELMADILVTPAVKFDVRQMEEAAITLTTNAAAAANKKCHQPVTINEEDGRLLSGGGLESPVSTSSRNTSTKIIYDPDNTVTVKDEFKWRLNNDDEADVIMAAVKSAANDAAAAAAGVHEMEEEKNLLPENVVVTADGRKRFKCEICPKNFVTTAVLSHHVKAVHLGSKEHKCGECDFTTAKASDLKAHIKAVHRQLKDLKCDECEFTTAWATHLNAHIKAVHMKMKKPKKYKCDQCDYVSAYSGHVNKHKKVVHLGELDYCCVLCAYAGSCSANLKRHVRVHHKEAASRAEEEVVDPLEMGMEVE